MENRRSEVQVDQTKVEIFRVSYLKFYIHVYSKNNVSSTSSHDHWNVCMYVSVCVPVLYFRFSCVFLRFMAFCVCYFV
jgi:hypothetical protein